MKVFAESPGTPIRCCCQELDILRRSLRRISTNDSKIQRTPKLKSTDDSNAKRVRWRDYETTKSGGWCFSNKIVFSDETLILIALLFCKVVAFGFQKFYKLLLRNKSIHNGSLFTVDFRWVASSDRSSSKMLLYRQQRLTKLAKATWYPSFLCQNCKIWIWMASGFSKTILHATCHSRRNNSITAWVIPWSYNFLFP